VHHVTILSEMEMIWISFMLKRSRKIRVQIFIHHRILVRIQTSHLRNWPSSCLQNDKSELSKKRSVDSYSDQKLKLNLFVNIHLGKIKNWNFHLNCFFDPISLKLTQIYLLIFIKWSRTDCWHKCEWNRYEFCSNQARNFTGPSL